MLPHLILVTTYIAMERGGIASSSVVVESNSLDETETILDTIRVAERSATRVHYEAVWLNREHKLPK